MKKKEVSMSELFFDLVFVFVLSTINHTVETISEDLASLESLGKNFTMFLIFFAIWVYRTLLVNRFFEQKWYQYLFVFIDMFLILLLSKATNADFQQTFKPFVMISMLIFLSIILQYCINYKMNKTAVTAQLVKVYVSGLFIMIVFSLISISLPAGVNFWVYFVGIIIMAIFPVLFLKVSKANPLFFSHFSERLSLFMILLFGEGIVQIVNNVQITHINILDIVYFILVVSLFMIYTLHYKKSLNYERNDATGFASAYLHLALIFTLDFIFLVMNKVLANHEISEVELYIYTFAFFIFLLVIFIDTQLHNAIIDKKLLFLSIVLIATIIGLIITNIYLVTIVEIVGILLICFIFYANSSNDEIEFK
ncbi:low temperature requirement protein A [Staphylococcus sp. ACRSN]|uniref:low temperature requirement protein A n=1 Tax=Staphylococcus sp. ACRSN TaxID=2918214 RepID=UPI001EF2323B|nr:low temperature requirement protein A [Staphylococcus sp. ACRSN]MCG7337911.1 low temperature requirement protein A [Staphylococcus sp. ACRSN]